MTAFGITLRNGRLVVELDRRGAVISSFRWRKTNNTSVPVLRDGAAHAGGPLKASCFPLLPFGNRVRGNCFTFGGQNFTLKPNQPWDRHYLHGDGWLTCWTAIAETAMEATLTMRHGMEATNPYAYAATIVYRLLNDALFVTMTVTNEAEQALPFGLGLHSYFPLTPQTTLQAPATGWFAEEAEFLPGARGAVPSALDFSNGCRLPRYWINNGFTGWNGRAEITWPEDELAIAITASACFRDYFVFMSDTRFEPEFAEDYFCFEPMTHHADAHHAADLGGLVILDPGASFTGEVRFEPHDHVAATGCI
jgi:aldose 1-epimerase